MLSNGHVHPTELSELIYCPPILYDKNIFQLIYPWLDTAEFKNITLVCRFWHQTIKMLKTIRAKHALINEFHVPLNVILSLASPMLVHAKLVRIFKRSSIIGFETSELKIFKIYCAGGTVNETLLRLLDVDGFGKYFGEANAYVSAVLFEHACRIGNEALAQYFIDEKNCLPQKKHFNLSIASGSLYLTKYLLDKVEFIITDNERKKLFELATLSGNVRLLQYLIKVLTPYTGDDLESLNAAISSGSVDMVKYLMSGRPWNFELQVGQKILWRSIYRSKSLEVIKYLSENFDMQYPSKHPYFTLRCFAYDIGTMDVIRYVENKFPCDNLGSSSRINLLDNVARSGNLEAIQHCIMKYDINIPKLTEDWRLDVLLQKVVLSGQVDALAFLLAQLNPETISERLNDCLLEPLSADRNVIKMLVYLESMGYIRDDHYATGDNAGNSELTSYLYHDVRKDPDPRFRCMFRCIRADELLILYHSIDVEGYPVDDEFLCVMFKGYHSNLNFERDEIERRSNSDLFILFMKYLIDVHGLKLTDEMIDKIEDDSHREWLSLPPRYQEDETFTCRLM